MSGTPVKRKLAAILAADAVGYSRLMGANEEGTMRVLSAHRAVIDGIIQFHDGRIVGTAGDSVLAEFASPVEALRCAVEIQAALKTRNESLPEANRLQFRIGINLGDVMVKGDDLLGDGVNVAARLEGIAEPGGICISSSVYDQIAGKLDLGFDEMGEKSLKNIERPVRVYRVHAGGAAPRPKRRARPAALYALATLAAVGALAAGWWRFLGPGAAPPAGPQPAVATAPAVAPVAHETRDSGEAARKEEERKLAAEREDARRKAEEAQIQSVRARAELEVAKARADAELAKAREEAEALRREAATELAAAKAPAPAPKAAEPTPVAARAAIVPAPAPVPARKAEAAPIAWMATLHCDSFRGSREFVNEVPVRFEGGTFTIQRRPAGMPGHFVVRGTPAADGTLSLSGSVIAPRGRKRGEELPAHLEGTLDAGRYVTKGYLGARACEVDIARAAR